MLETCTKAPLGRLCRRRGKMGGHKSKTLADDRRIVVMPAPGMLWWWLLLPYPDRTLTNGPERRAMVKHAPTCAGGCTA